MKKDPYSVRNIAGEKEFEQIKNALRKQMDSELNAQNDPHMSGKGYLFDQYPYAEDKVRDYYNRYKKGEKIKEGWIGKVITKLILSLMKLL